MENKDKEEQNQQNFAQTSPTPWSGLLNISGGT